MLIENNIFDKEKIFLLRDPVINCNLINKKKKENLIESFLDQEFYLSIGRLTDQKNFEFLINSFSKNINKFKIKKLVILGEGENDKKLKKLIKNYSMENNIFLLGFKKNVYNYIFKSKTIISCSLYEDPGFVLIESAFCRSFIISSNCPNGPKEIIGNNSSGLLYNSGDDSSFLEKISLFLNMSSNEIQNMKKNALKKSKLFTIFSHAKTLAMLLRDN
jgi:glycosyltransferase involved in cell wall biosynthesis